MNSNNIAVYINKDPSGELSLEAEQYVFNYSDEAREIVSLTMPIRKASWVSKKLHPIFDMNMPEGALREAIKNHFAKIQTMDNIALLKLIGPYMLGRVKFEKVVEEEEYLTLDTILNSDSENLFEELMQKFAIRSGVSGVQPKLLLTTQNKTTMKFEHFIVKSWEKEYAQLALNEYFCMRAVKKCGLPVPEFYLSDDLSMFIMKRFDIKDDDRYLGFEDMCVLTARNTEEKYNGSYEEIIKVIKDVIPAEHRKEDIRTFFTAIIMNHLLRNGDGHLKNYGVVYDHDFEDARLAPIYDVITTTVYLKNDIPALKLSDGRLWFKEKTYKNFAKASCGLSNKEYQTIVEKCIQAVQTTREEIDTFMLKNKSTEKFLMTLKEHWQSTL